MFLRQRIAAAGPLPRRPAVRTSGRAASHTAAGYAPAGRRVPARAPGARWQRICPKRAKNRGRKDGEVSCQHLPGFRGARQVAHLAAAAVFREKGHQVSGRRKVRLVDHKSAFLPRRDHAGVCQLFQVEG
ncbi:hypothetical protein A9G14_07125 [Gilliamella apicola]|nr:hypothetical protein A9G14_07125 [Gilliamella apicola]